MTNVGILKECPNCNQQLLVDKQKHCTNCGFDLSWKKENADFGTPDYYAYQVAELAISSAQTRGNEDLKGQRIEDFKVKLKTHMEHISGEEFAAIMSDAYGAMETIMARIHTVDHLKQAITLGKKIGHIAVSVENTYKSVGVFNAESEGLSEFTEQ